MEITRHTSLESAWTKANPWRALTEATPLLSPEWLLTWWKYFGNQSELFLLEAKDRSGKSVGFAPFYAVKKMGSYQLRAIGSGTVCTDYVKPIASTENEREVNQSFCQFLAMHFREMSTFQTLELAIEGIESGAPWVDAFCDLIAGHGFRCWESRLEGGFNIDLPPTWKEYLNGIGHSAKRKSKKVLARFESGQVQFESTADPDRILERLPDLQRIHQARRISLGQSGSYSDPRFGPFLHEAVSLLAQRGKVRMEWCESEGQLIAMHLVLVGVGGSFMYHSGIDPRFVALEPGHALTVAAVRRAIQSGDSFYNLLRGEEPYKSYWGGKCVKFATLRCSPPRAVSRIVGITHQSLWEMKQSLKTARNWMSRTLRSETKSNA